MDSFYQHFIASSSCVLLPECCSPLSLLFFSTVPNAEVDASLLFYSIFYRLTSFDPNFLNNMRHLVTTNNTIRWLYRCGCAYNVLNTWNLTILLDTKELNLWFRQKTGSLIQMEINPKCGAVITKQTKNEKVYS